MFNFMLVVFGIFANAVVSSVDKHLPRFASIALCLIAAILALIFTLLDRRNRDLVWFGEDILVELERRNIFGETKNVNNRQEEEIPFGILWRQEREEKRKVTRWWRDALLGKHRIWLRTVGYMFALAFAVAAYLIWMYGDQNITPSDLTSPAS